jgi:hypothetical protein
LDIPHGTRGRSSDSVSQEEPERGDPDRCANGSPVNPPGAMKRDRPSPRFGALATRFDPFEHRFLAAM